MGASAAHPVNTTVEAGLPNIKGRMGGFYNEMRGEFGALYYSETNNATKTSSATWERGKTLYFDASRSNSIYGASNTVQPPAYYLYIWKRIE